jgi:AraC-like DNA-binding protein
MPKKTNSIPVNTLPAGVREGIVIARSLMDGAPDAEEVERAHRDNGFVFIVQEKGNTHIEIDFQTHNIEPSSLIYIHPNQVHRLIAFEHAAISSWIITAENLQPEYLKLLEDITPAPVLSLHAEALAIISETASMCIKLSERKDEKLYDSILKESCNTLVALVVSQYLAQSKPADKYSRFEIVTHAFKSALERDFTTVKSPAAYAESLNVSTPYLNECVKVATGHSVSHQIQQRVLLEAKRLLCHSNKSAKEIAVELGYDDYTLTGWRHQMCCISNKCDV